MSPRKRQPRWVRAFELGAAVAGAAAAATAAGLAAQRTVAKTRARRDDVGFGSVRADGQTVRTDDGVTLHVEVDDVDEPAAADSPTLVFVHGYLLSMDCWHFQREVLRGRHRTVLFDQRSHGRSGRSDAAHSTIEQLGRDLGEVLAAVAPTGPLVLVGHSLGGMTLMSLAEQMPELVSERVVGTAFIATSAGNVGRLLPGAPGRVLDTLQPFVIGALAKLPVVVETGRRNTAFAMTRRLAFGGPVPDSYVVFVDQMISATPSQVVWDFLPALRLHDRYLALAAYADAPSVVIVGAQDAILPFSHAQRLAEELGGVPLLELDSAGHMVMIEQPERVTAALEDLVERGRAYGAGR